ncbi:AAA family ATPase [Lentisphaera profundi]
MVYVISSPIYTVFTYPDIKMYINIFYVYVFTRLAVQVCHAMAYRRNYVFNQEDHPELREKTLRIFAFYIAFTLIIKRLAENSLTGCWVIQSWLYWFLVSLLVAAFYFVLRAWKLSILKMLDDIQDETFFIKKLKARSQGKINTELTVAIGVIYFFIKGSFQWLLILVSSISIFRPMMASFLSLKTTVMEEEKGLTLIDHQMYSSTNHSSIIEEYALDELKQFSEKEIPTGLNLICGERGLGKTIFLQRLQKKLNEGYQSKFYSCTRSNNNDFIDNMKSFIKESKENKIQKAVIFIDDIHLVQKAQIGGIEVIDDFIKLIRKEQESIRWIVSIDSEAWQFLKRVRAKKILFESVTKLPKWEIHQLKTMISSRIKEQGHSISFQGLVIPRHLDGPQIDGRRKKDLSYYRILNDYSEGNPSVALYCFNLSLYKQKNSDKIEVRLFNPPSLAELESMPALTYFVLRSIVQMGSTNKEDLRLSSAEKKSLVDDCIHLLLFHGFIEEHNEFYHISIRWFRPIITILQRQHLLSK